MLNNANNTHSKVNFTNILHFHSAKSTGNIKSADQNSKCLLNHKGGLKFGIIPKKPAREGKVKCNLGLTELAYVGGSTGTMANHLKHKHKSVSVTANYSK